MGKWDGGSSRMVPLALERSFQRRFDQQTPRPNPPLSSATKLFALPRLSSDVATFLGERTASGSGRDWST